MWFRRKEFFFLNIRLHRWKASQIWLNACMCKMWSHKNIKHYMIGNGNWSIKEENKQLFNFSFIFFARLSKYLTYNKKKTEKKLLNVVPTTCNRIWFLLFFCFLFTFDYSFRSRLYSFFFALNIISLFPLIDFFCLCAAI